MRCHFTLSIGLLVLWGTGCTDPCAKALKKIEACHHAELKEAGKDPKTQEPTNDSAIFTEVCKLERDKFKGCLGINDCDEYRKCISEAATDPRAVEMLKATGEWNPDRQAAKPAEKPAEPAEKPAEPAEKPAEPAAGE